MFVLLLLRKRGVFYRHFCLFGRLEKYVNKWASPFFWTFSVFPKSFFHKQSVAEYFSGSLLPPLFPSTRGWNTLERDLDAFSSHIYKCPLTIIWLMSLILDLTLLKASFFSSIDISFILCNGGRPAFMYLKQGVYLLSFIVLNLFSLHEIWVLF